MNKYLHVISTGLQNNLQYRFNYLTRTLFSFIPLFAMLSLWRTIYAHNGAVAGSSGFTQPMMIFYYLLVAVVDDDVFDAPLAAVSVVAVLVTVSVEPPSLRPPSQVKGAPLTIWP